MTATCPSCGYHLGQSGRRPGLPMPIYGAVLTDRSAGKSYARIASDLTEWAIPTSQGGIQWWPTSVQAVARAAGRRATATLMALRW